MLTFTLWSSSALAHDPGLSTAWLTEDHVVVLVAAREVSDPAVVWGALTLTVDGQPCSLAPHAPEPDDDGLRLTASHSCPPGEVYGLHAGHLAALSPGHRMVVDAFGTPQGVLDAAHPDLTVNHEAQASVVPSFLHLGVEHIVTGWDHLAFLLGLLVVARTWREMATIATGFTLAHSVTLSAGALGWVSMPSAWVEPIIALSIAAVGIENLLTDPPLRRRLATTFGLGLVHGFGFAGMLAEIGLPEGQALWALLAFNGGVELGQLAIVAVALPILLAIRQTAHAGQASRLVSLGLTAAGVFWFLQRIG